MSAILNSLCCCFRRSRLVDPDETDETAVTVPAIRALSKQVESLTEKIRQLNGKIEMFKAMKKRPQSQYTPEENALFEEAKRMVTSPFRVGPSYSAPPPIASSGLLLSEESSSECKKIAEEIEAVVSSQKYYNGVKIGNWDANKGPILKNITYQLLQQVGNKGLVGNKRLADILNKLEPETKRELDPFVSGVKC